MQYLRDNSGVLESSADGTTWHPVAKIEGNVLKNGNGWLRYNTTSSVWQYSNNAGQTWQDMGSGSGGGGGMPSEVANPFLLGSLHVRSNAGALECSPDGSTWTPIGSGGGSGSGGLSPIHIVNAGNASPTSAQCADDIWILGDLATAQSLTLPSITSMEDGARLTILLYKNGSTINKGDAENLLFKTNTAAWAGGADITTTTGGVITLVLVTFSDSLRYWTALSQAGTWQVVEPGIN